jgi:hypothetical protein
VIRHRLPANVFFDMGSDDTYGNARSEPDRPTAR